MEKSWNQSNLGLPGALPFVNEQFYSITLSNFDGSAEKKYYLSFVYPIYDYDVRKCCTVGTFNFVYTNYSSEGL